MTVLSASILLFLVLDPIGNLPLFVSTLKDVAPERQRRVIFRELLLALGVLVFFLFAGRPVLHLLNLSEPALSLAGGIILFLIALKMVFPRANGQGEERLDGEPFLVPLAIPLIAGPSAMASLMLIMSREPERWPEWLLALGLAWAATGAILLGAGTTARVLGRRGLIALERLMGMVLTTIAVEMFLTGVAMFLEG